jgi:hypothetical protein
VILVTLVRFSYLALIVGISERLVLPSGPDQIAGPVIISALLFFAVLANFILRGALRFTSNDLPLNHVRSLWFSSRAVSRFPCVYRLPPFNRTLLQTEGECYHPWSWLFDAVSLTLASARPSPLAHTPDSRCFFLVIYLSSITPNVYGARGAIAKSCKGTILHQK